MTLALDTLRQIHTLLEFGSARDDIDEISIIAIQSRMLLAADKARRAIMVLEVAAAIPLPPASRAGDLTDTNSPEYALGSRETWRG